MSRQSNKVLSQEGENREDLAPISLKRILVAVDASEYSDRALKESIRLAGSANGVVTGIHAYAAALHDRRFRQMEGGLPERYKQEEEMEYQREVHDDLITRGLSIITDSYHDTGQAFCAETKVPYQRLSPEGKNYRRVVEAAESGDFDMIALGALGLGAVPGAVIGTVCERTVRRSPIDTLVIRSPKKKIGDGPIVVAMDGSDIAFGCLKTAIDIAGRVDAEVHVVAAYDPYYHYVAFNKISKVLSDEAGKVFRFKEQEALHEELIDEGIAKIYQSHLMVAETVAKEAGSPVKATLLDGKPYKAIAKYLEKVGASLLVIGKTGIHSDDTLDIGGVTENLLRQSPCSLWIGQKTFQPPMDVVAEETISWSEEAEETLERAPDFARGMARKAIVRFAHEKGHTFITRSIVDEVASQMMPGRGGSASAREVADLEWTAEAMGIISVIADESVRDNVKWRSEKSARRDGMSKVQLRHVREFMEEFDLPFDLPEENVSDEDLPDDGLDVSSETEEQDAFEWDAAALARITRVPEMMREPTRARIEAVAASKGVSRIDLEIVEEGLAAAREAMKSAMAKGGHPGAQES